MSSARLVDPKDLGLARFLEDRVAGLGEGEEGLFGLSKRKEWEGRVNPNPNPMICNRPPNDYYYTYSITTNPPMCPLLFFSGSIGRRVPRCRRKRICNRPPNYYLGSRALT